jgi:hypothetical protein
VREATQALVSDPVAREEEERTIRLSDEEWTVRVEGSGTSGRRADSGAPLLHLVFSPSDGSDSRSREVLAIGRSVEVYTVQELTALFHSASPHAAPPDESKRASRRAKRSGKGRDSSDSS